MGRDALIYLFRNASMVVTFDKGPFKGGFTESDIGILRHATIAVSRGKILWIGPDKDFDPSLFVDTRIVEFDVSGQTVIPGIIDPHTHLIYAGDRMLDWIGRFRGWSYETIKEKGGGILRTVKNTRHARENQLKHETTQRALRKFVSGVTTIEAKTGYGLSAPDEVRLIRILAQLSEELDLVELIPTFLPAHAIPPNIDRTAYIETIVEHMLPLVFENKWARYFDVFCDSGYYTVEETLYLIQQARERGFHIRLHIDELSHTGFVEQNDTWAGIHSVDHLEHTTPEEIERLASEEIACCLIPTTRFHFNLKQPEIESFLKNGAILTFASDHNPGTNPVYNPWYTLWLACVTWNLPVHLVLAGMTIHAAYSLRLHGRIGKIQPGFRADFIILNMPSYHYLAYQWDLIPVSYVVRNGRPYEIRENAEIRYTWERFEHEE